MQAINKWCAENTNGKITKLFGQLDPATLLVLADAVYFYAKWTTPFESATTRSPRRSPPPPGTSSRCRPCAAPNWRAQSAVRSGYKAVQLDYRA